MGIEFEIVAALVQKARFDVSRYQYMATEQDVHDHVCWKAAEEIKRLRKALEDAGCRY